MPEDPWTFARSSARACARRYEDAVNAFSLAILEDPTDHVFLSNRSACFASLKDFKRALKVCAFIPFPPS